MNISPKLFIPKSSAKKTFTLFAVLSFLLIISLWAAVFFGSTNTSVFQAVKALLNGNYQDTAYRIIFHVRLPRVAAAVLAGSAVSFAGLLGFVGLVVPHIMRRFVGANHMLLIPAGALGGSILVLLCDLAGRMLFAPYEVPVGIILSFVGGPFFIMLILTRRKGRIND